MATSSFEGTVLIPTFLFQLFHVSLDLLNMDCLIRIRRGILVFKTIPMSCMSRRMCFICFHFVLISYLDLLVSYVASSTASIYKLC